MKLTDIKYPIFSIRTYNKLYEKDNIIYIESYKGKKILDNKNLKGNTLAKRRLKMPLEKRYQLNLCIFNIAQLLKHKSYSYTYVDVYGKVFKYQKTRMVPLIYRKVIKIFCNKLKIKDVNCLIEIDQGTIDSFKGDNMYAELLQIDGSYLFLGLESTKKKDTRRKI